MLGLFGVITIAALLVLIMTKRLQTMLALILVPIVSCLIAGYAGLIKLEKGVFTIKTLGTFITKGLTSIAPTGVMFIFAILFFGILTDAGTFEPIINKILKTVGKDPVKIAVGTLVLACIVHLDGSGAVTFLIVIPAMMPLYKKMGMKMTTLATLTALGAGTMNILPWGGPTLRAITALNSSVDKIFTPILVPFAAGLIFIVLVAVFLGKREKNRLKDTLDAVVLDEASDTAKDDKGLKRPQLFWINILLILAAIVVMLKAILPPAVVFMIATSLALLINYRDIKTQKDIVDSHAKSALMMASMLFAAGAFIGIMQSSGMLTAMAQGLVKLLPQSLGKAMPIIVGVISMPASLVFDPDSYYFGVLPVLSQAAQAYGLDPTMVARASIIGQMTTGFPVSPLTASTFLLTGLSGIDLAEHQKSTFVYAFMTTLVMLVVGVVTGAI
ncbi:MAG: citrate:proton symporter [Fusobacteriaceae bacterium]|jgi:CitMHS family citrate-Mg2+:H+ or citrate-Ca2+:H+ symporter|nr:citrate:proton symporter [Fusobacteriaceae bacterium]